MIISRQDIVGQFKRPTGYFGRLVGWFMAHRSSNRLRNEWTVDQLQLNTGEAVLEVGCGPGYAAQYLLRRFPKAAYVGIDHSEVMLRQAFTRNEAAVFAGRVTFRLGSLDVLKDMPLRFAAIFSSNVMQFFPERQLALRTLAARLAHGGVLLTTFQPRSANASAAEAHEWASQLSADYRAAGFANVEVRELSLKPVPAVCIIGRELSAPSGA